VHLRSIGQHCPLQVVVTAFGIPHRFGCPLDRLLVGKGV
jgi:hypothetical protein